MKTSFSAGFSGMFFFYLGPFFYFQLIQTLIKLIEAKFNHQKRDALPRRQDRQGSHSLHPQACYAGIIKMTRQLGWTRAADLRQGLNEWRRLRQHRAWPILGVLPNDLKYVTSSVSPPSPRPPPPGVRSPPGVPPSPPAGGRENCGEK